MDNAFPFTETRPTGKRANGRVGFADPPDDLEPSEGTDPTTSKEAKPDIYLLPLAKAKLLVDENVVKLREQLLQPKIAPMSAAFLTLTSKAMRGRKHMERFSNEPNYVPSSIPTLKTFQLICAGEHAQVKEFKDLETQLVVAKNNMIKEMRRLVEETVTLDQQLFARDTIATFCKIMHLTAECYVTISGMDKDYSEHVVVMDFFALRHKDILSVLSNSSDNISMERVLTVYKEENKLDTLPSSKVDPNFVATHIGEIATPKTANPYASLRPPQDKEHSRGTTILRTPTPQGRGTKTYAGQGNEKERGGRTNPPGDSTMPPPNPEGSVRGNDDHPQQRDAVDLTQPNQQKVAKKKKSSFRLPPEITGKGNPYKGGIPHQFYTEKGTVTRYISPEEASEILAYKEWLQQYSQEMLEQDSTEDEEEVNQTSRKGAAAGKNDNERGATVELLLTQDSEESDTNDNTFDYEEKEEEEKEEKEEEEGEEDEIVVVEPPIENGNNNSSSNEAEGEKNTATESRADRDSSHLTAIQAVATIGEASKKRLTDKERRVYAQVEMTFELMILEPMIAFLKERLANIGKLNLMRKWNKRTQQESEDALKLVRAEQSASRPVLKGLLKQQTEPLQKKLRAAERKVDRMEEKMEADMEQQERRKQRKREKRQQKQKRKREIKAQLKREEQDALVKEEDEGDGLDPEDDDEDITSDDSTIHPKGRRGSQAEQRRKKKQKKTPTVNNQKQPATDEGESDSSNNKKAWKRNSFSQRSGKRNESRKRK